MSTKDLDLLAAEAELVRSGGDSVSLHDSALEAAQGADLVVFSIHWGPNMRQAPTPLHISTAASKLPSPR